MITKDEIKEYKKQDFEDLYSNMIDLCIDGNLEHLSYLLSKKIYPIKSINGLSTLREFFSYACDRGNIHILEYLLTSPDVKAYPSIDLNSEKNNFLRTCITHKQLAVAQYLIFDKNIIYSDFIKSIISNEPQIQNMFEKRELNNTLNETLHIDKTNINSAKIKI